MLATKKAGLLGQPPPERITEVALDAAGVEPISEPAKHALAGGAHLGFGALSGSLFGFLHRQLRLPIPPVAYGIAFGLAVWGISYKGWIPAAGILPPPEHDRSGRPGSMIAAHCVYGAILATVVDRLERKGHGR